jgi:hypothetical protein
MPLEPEVKAKIDAAVDAAMTELRAQYNGKAEPTGDWVIGWYARHKNTATYKYLGQAVVAFAKERGL